MEETNSKLLDLNSKLENQTSQLKEFAYISSHNLRSPAGNIKALLDFYKGDPSTENLEFLLEKLDKVSDDLLNTINDLAEVVKIKNEISAETNSIELFELFERAKDSLSQTIRGKHATIDINLNGISKIKSSKTYFDSIILNLISNSLKYSKENVPPRVEITTYELGQHFIMKIKDNGRGIDLEKYRSKVFGLRKTFHKNKDARGVGLFITEAQIESLDGTTDVDSKVDEGSTFTIKLPVEIIVK